MTIRHRAKYKSVLNRYTAPHGIIFYDNMTIVEHCGSPTFEIVMINIMIHFQRLTLRMNGIGAMMAYLFIAGLT